MCGIIGYIGKEPAVPILIEGLKKLEYRGYDSSGVAVLQTEARCAKSGGQAAKTSSPAQNGYVAGRIGVGHVRWATHGRPSEENAHPHRAGRIVVVHNGIIENYLALKKELAAQGVSVRNGHGSDSPSDRQHVQKAPLEGRGARGGPAPGRRLRDRGDRRAKSRYRGRARKRPPLVVGLGQGEFFLASDIPAILHRTRDVCS